MTEACLQVFDQLRRRFFYKDQTKIPKQEDRNFVVAVCRSWFDEYRNGLAMLGIEEKFLLEIDKSMRLLLQAATSSKRRSFYRQQIVKANKILEKIQVDAQIAEWRSAKNDSLIGDVNIRNTLKNLDPDLERRYLQAIYDLNDSKRTSYAGTANEIREIIRIVLSLQAPDKEVGKTSWFKESRQKQRDGIPERLTHAERVKFILEKRRAGGKEVKSAQENEKLIDGLLGNVVRSSYDRMNAGVHGKKAKEEIIRSLRYVHAFLCDILPS